MSMSSMPVLHVPGARTDRRHLALAALAGLTGLLAGLLPGTAGATTTSTVHGLAVAGVVVLVVLARGAARRHLDRAARSAAAGAGVLAAAQGADLLDVTGHPRERPAA